MVVLIELYPFIPVSVTLIVFSRSQQCQTISTENFMFLSSRLKFCVICEGDNEYTTIFDFCMCSREIIDVYMSSFEKKKIQSCFFLSF